MLNETIPKQNNEKEVEDEEKEKYMYIKIFIHSDLTLNEHRNMKHRNSEHINQKIYETY